MRNEGRGYGQASLSSSVPWVRFERVQVGCLSGAEVSVGVQIDAAALPLQRDHHAIIACSPTRGARISVPVTAELSLLKEALRRIRIGLRTLTSLARRGIQRGLLLWTRTFRSVVRSRYGLWILLAETVVLAAAMVLLWWNWRGASPDFGDLTKTFLFTLPMALAAIYLVPALAFVGGAVAWEVTRALVSRSRK
jgi:hypothetical protein